MVRPVTERLNGKPDQEHDQRKQHERGRNAGERREPGRRAVVEDMDVEAKSPSELVSAQFRSSSILPPGCGRRKSATPMKIAPVASVAMIGWIRP